MNTFNRTSERSTEEVTFGLLKTVSYGALLATICMGALMLSDSVTDTHFAVAIPGLIERAPAAQGAAARRAPVTQLTSTSTPIVPLSFDTRSASHVNQVPSPSQGRGIPLYAWLAAASASCFALFGFLRQREQKYSVLRETETQFDDTVSSVAESLTSHLRGSHRYSVPYAPRESRLVLQAAKAAKGKGKGGGGAKGKIAGIIKLALPAGKATPAPPVGPALGQYGLNIVQFCKEYNAATEKEAADGMIIPVEITAMEDRTYTFVLKTPPASVLLRKAAKVEKGSADPKSNIVGSITRSQLEEIAKIKLPDLNTQDVQMAMRIVEGTAKNMGISITA